MNNSIFNPKEYGRVVITVKETMEKKEITRNKLSKLAGIGYNTVNRYYKNELENVDLDILAKLCFVLECDIKDVLKYEKP